MRLLSAFVLPLLLGQATLGVEATYTATFDTLWTSIDHPNSYPNTAHFSPLIGVSHSNNVTFWEPGSPATAGIERVAELGSTGVFRQEIDAAVQSGEALQRTGLGQNLFAEQSATSSPFSVTSGYPLVTFATMVAPSSDWFVGVHGLDLREGSGFVEEVVIEFTSFYDAGTEEGSGFSLSNPPTNPRGVITHVTGGAAAAPFLGDPQAILPPIARLTLTRTSIVGLPGDYNSDGEVTIADHVVWADQFGQSGMLSADGNNDGRVDAADYTLWRDALSASATGVPEPATSGLIVLAAMAGFAVHQSRSFVSPR